MSDKPQLSEKDKKLAEAQEEKEGGNAKEEKPPRPGPSILGMCLRSFSVTADLLVTYVDEVFNGSVEKTFTPMLILVVVCWVISFVVDTNHLLKVEEYNRKKAEERWKNRE